MQGEPNPQSWGSECLRGGFLCQQVLLHVWPQNPSSCVSFCAFSSGKGGLHSCVCSHLSTRWSAGPFCRTLDVWDIDDVGEAMPPSLASALYFLVQTASIILLWSSTTLWCWAVQASWGFSKHPALPWWPHQWKFATKVQETSLLHCPLQKGNSAETAGGSFRCKHRMNLEKRLKI